ncbi:MAG: DUF1761 domain-containing protein [Bacteroidia bacterium]|nr:DUF1761 domain-containing protein [Bacteroidia bacterium]
MENIHINMTAVLIAVAACFVFGFIWYTPLFGKAWAKEMGMNTDQKPPASALVKGMIFMLIGNFLMAYVFAHNMAVWNPLTWGQPAAAMSTMETACMAAFFTWLGFYVPGELGRVAWEGKSWKLFAINSGHNLLSLFIAALILANMY